MPFGRKQHGKSSVSHRTHGSHVETQKHSQGVHNTPDREFQTTSVSAGGSFLSVPRHPVMPELPPGQGELFFECTLFLYSVLALFLQYLNLYKTMWWLPNSYTHHAVKFYLIDPYLLSCVGLILGRRVTWCFLKKITIIPPGEEDTVPNYIHVIEWVLKVPMIVAVLSSFMFSFLRVLGSYEFSSLLYLAYPAMVYFLLFYNETFAIRAKQGGKLYKNLLIDLEGICHACTASPIHIREEADLLVFDLSQRCKLSFFSAFTTAYFAIYVPCCFTPLTMHVDYWWVGEMIVVVFLTSLSLYFAYLLPLHYCDLLHRAASHLGCWEKLEKSAHPTIVNYAVWTDANLWNENQIVKYGRFFYRAQGSQQIAAEPGNSEHSRFFHLSSDPLRLLNFLCMMEGLLILCQFLMLVHSTDWQHIMTLVLLMFGNYLLLFKLFKDKVILGRVYYPSPEDEETFISH